MTEEPLVVGAALLVAGIFVRIVASPIQRVFDIWIGSWGALLVILGLVIIIVRLIVMVQDNQSRGGI